MERRDEVGEFFYICAVFNMIMVEEEMNVKFMHEAIEKWDGSSRLPIMIEVHQAQRWFDIIRSN